LTFARPPDPTSALALAAAICEQALVVIEKSDAAFAANLTDSLLAARNAAGDAMRQFA
jgi:hypothetical protein